MLLLLGVLSEQKKLVPLHNSKLTSLKVSLLQEEYWFLSDSSRYPYIILNMHTLDGIYAPALNFKTSQCLVLPLESKTNHNVI